MALNFITSSKNKFAEVQAVIPGIEQLETDLPEIQELDPHAIISAKLAAARGHAAGAYIVEDTSLYFEGMKGLPGPFIKWFLQSLGLDGLAALAAQYGAHAVAKTLIGYTDEKGELKFFEGEVQGTIVAPRGENAFGWDVIFVPEGQDKTFAELGAEEKIKISMRRKAADKLKEYLKIPLED